MVLRRHPRTIRKPTTPASRDTATSGPSARRRGGTPAEPRSLLVRTALQTVLTEENVSWLVTEAEQPPAVRRSHVHSSVTRQDVKQTSGKTRERLVLAADSARESRDFLGKVIVAEIQIYTRTAIICYILPLPGDSPMAGMRRQEVDLPEEALA